jgi:hypothetical protein
MNERQEVSRGHEAVFSFRSDLTGCVLVFEDDGECGYLYVLNAEQEIEEAVFVYKFESSEPNKSEVLEVAWSADGWSARVQLGGELVALVNYRLQQVFNASNFPSLRRWSQLARAEAEARFLALQ